MGSEETKKLILARRARFVAAALAGVAATTTTLVASVEGCGGETVDEPTIPEPSPTADASKSTPQPCLSVDADAPPDDSGTAADAADRDANGKDAEPQPCLAPRPDG